MNLKAFKTKASLSFLVVSKNKHFFMTTIFLAGLLAIVFSVLIIWYCFNFFEAFSYKMMSSFIVIILLSNILAKLSIDLIKRI
jgi:hypothetical protein